MDFLQTTPLSVYSIVAAYVIAWYPSNAKVRLVTKVAGRYNNVRPRQNIADLEKKGVAPEIIHKVNMYEGAHQNGLEIFPLWSVAVLAANVAKVETSTLNYFSLAFVASRLLYNYLYINQTKVKQSLARSVTWAVGTLLSLTLLVKAANKLRA